MFGGLRLKRTCLASNNKAIMALNILCTGDHAHAPWSMHDGIFNTAREAEYTPQLAKALATTVLGVHCRSVSIAECFSGVKAAQVVTFSFYCSWQTTVQNDISAGRP